MTIIRKDTKKAKFPGTNDELTNINHDFDKEALFVIPNVMERPLPNGEIPKFITRHGLPAAMNQIDAELLSARTGGEPFPLPLDWVEGEDYVLLKS